MNTNSTVMRGDVLGRIKMAFRTNGEWVLLGLFCFLCATGGYSLASWQDQDTVLQNQVNNDTRLKEFQAEWSAERQGFRDRLEARNRDLVAKGIAYEELAKTIAGQSKESSQAANSSAKAAESANKALQTISKEKIEGDDK